MFRAGKAHALAKLMLVWWVAFMAVAVAAPGLASPATHQVCSAAGGMATVVLDDSAGGPRAQLDCPLCLPSALAAPPTVHTPRSACTDGHGAVAAGPVPTTQAIRPWQARAPPALGA